MPRRPLFPRSTLAALLLVFVAHLLFGAAAKANSLAADVSSRLIAITAAFIGGEVVVFGATETEGDIIIVVEGPRQNQMVRRKARVAGIWINRDRVEFVDAPSYFAIATSGPLDEIVNPSIRDQLQLGVDYLKLKTAAGSGYSKEELDAFAEALIRNKERKRLYTVRPNPIRFPGSKLFRATFSFPANVPPGLYRIEVFHLKDGHVNGAQQSGLQISKVGMEAEIYDFARQNAPLYGLVAILIAVTAGWLAGMIFRKA
jgi:uncharacterized protein (TIGR02186 family)